MTELVYFLSLWEMLSSRNFEDVPTKPVYLSTAAKSPAYLTKQYQIYSWSAWQLFVSPLSTPHCFIEGILLKSLKRDQQKITSSKDTFSVQQNSGYGQDLDYQEFCC